MGVALGSGIEEGLDVSGVGVHREGVSDLPELENAPVERVRRDGIVCADLLRFTITKYIRKTYGRFQTWTSDPPNSLEEVFKRKRK